MSKEKIYVGTGKEFGQYGTINISICLSDLPKDFITEAKNGKKYINLKVQKKKEVDQYGKTHYVEIDTWKPEEKKETQESDIDLPF
jgi:ribosomal protein L15E